jgi:hypothetical protein
LSKFFITKGEVNMGTCVRVPLNGQHCEEYWRNIRGHEPVRWNRVTPLERERARLSLDLTPAELAQLLSYGQETATSVEDIERWESGGELRTEDAESFVYRVFLAATAVHDDVHRLNRNVPVAQKPKPVKPEQREPVMPDLSKQVAVASVKGDY